MVFPILDRVFDVFVLCPLVAATQKQHNRRSRFRVAGAITRADINAQLPDAFTTKFAVAKVATGQAVDAALHCHTSSHIAELVKLVLEQVFAGCVKVMEYLHPDTLACSLISENGPSRRGAKPTACSAYCTMSAKQGGIRIRAHRLEDFTVRDRRPARRAGFPVGLGHAGAHVPDVHARHVDQVGAAADRANVLELMGVLLDVDTDRAVELVGLADERMPRDGEPFGTAGCANAGRIQ